MTPVLLDQFGLLRAGIAAILIMAGIFVSGYTIGYRSAESGGGVDLKKSVEPVLPKLARADLSEFDSLASSVQMPGAEIDLDRPDIVADAIDQPTATTVKQTVKQPAAVVSDSTNAIEAPVLIDTAVAPSLRRSSQQHHALASGADMDAGFDTIQSDSDGGQTVGQAQDTDATPPAANGRATRTGSGIQDTAGADGARYTVQVGVFSNTDNAIRKKTELELLKLSAYINEYRNKRDQLRYNVRFGYFKDKSSATAALSRFEQEMSGSGYVTKIRRH